MRQNVVSVCLLATGLTLLVWATTARRAVADGLSDGVVFTPPDPNDPVWTTDGRIRCRYSAAPCTDFNCTVQNVTYNGTAYVAWKKDRDLPFGNCVKPPNPGAGESCGTRAVACAFIKLYLTDTNCPQAFNEHVTVYALNCCYPPT